MKQEIMANIGELCYDDRMKVLMMLKDGGAKICSNGDGCRVNLDVCGLTLLNEIHVFIMKSLIVPDEHKF